MKNENYEKLIELLKKSTFYNPYALLGVSEENSILEVNIILYSRLKRYEDALKIIVDKLKSYDRAEKFCLDADEEVEKELKNKLKENKSIDNTPFTETSYRSFLYSLLKVYISLSVQNNELFDLSIELLNKYPTKFNPTEVLEMLPDNIPISKIQRFLNISIRNVHHRYRYSQVVRNMESTEFFKYRSKIMEETEKSILISRNTTCPLCKKKNRKRLRKISKWNHHLLSMLRNLKPKPMSSDKNHIQERINIIYFYNQSVKEDLIILI